MEEQMNIFDDFIVNYKNYIEKFESFKSEKKPKYKKVTLAYLNEKSETKKFCLLLAKEIIEDNNIIYNEQILFNGKLREEVIKVINEGIKSNIELNDFIFKLLKISKVIENLSKVVEIYSGKKGYNDADNIILFTVFFFKKNLKNILILKI